jgi:mannose-6-phosphate isomerase
LLVRISGEAKNYAWGSKSLIQDHLGIGTSGEVIAEVWFGTHPSGESLSIETSQNLSQVISAKLSFLAKFLAAETPLSIQVHPNQAQAIAGFEKENQLGLSLDDPVRNYRDPLPKPELLIALTPFRALCGFRPKSETAELFSALAVIDPNFQQLAEGISNGTSLEQTFTSVLTNHALAEKVLQSFDALAINPSDSDLVASGKALLQELAKTYPGDTGVLVALMLNLVELNEGQAIYLPAGNLHAYLSGLGFEVMAASDNVIRGGLTSKHVDRAELVAITNFAELSVPVVQPKKLAEGLIEYPVAANEFKVYRAEVSATNLLADIDLPAGAMVVCVSGEVAVGTSLEEREVLRRSEVVYLTGAKKFSLSGSGTVFVVLGAN